MKSAEEALTVGVDRARLDLLSHAERLTANRFNSLLRSLGRSKDRLDAIEARMAWHAEQVALPPIPDAPKADGERSHERQAADR